MSDRSDLREQFPDGFWVGEWYVEPMLNRVQRDGEEVQLEPKVMEVLLCLAARPGKTITKEAFKERVWAGTVVTDDVLSRCISELRKAFGDDAVDPDYIETIRKTGYRLLVPVHAEEESSSGEDSGSSAASSPEEDASPTEGGQWWGRIPRGLEGRFGEEVSLRGAGGIVPLALVGLFLIAGLYWYWSGSGSSQENAPTPVAPFTSFRGEETAPALSSDGQQVAFVWARPDSLTQNVYLLQEGAERPLPLSSDSTVDRSPTWSPDDRFIAYVRRVGGEHQVAVVPSIGGQSQPLLRLPDRRIHSIAWAPDTSRRTFAVSAQRRAHRAFALYRFVPEADSVGALTAPPLWSTGDRHPAFSPDGSRIAFIRGETPGVDNLYVVPATGGDPTQVTTDSTTIADVAWAADGEDLLYSARRNGVTGIWRVPVDGGEVTLVRSVETAGELAHFAHASGSRRLVYAKTSTQYDLWTLRRPSQYADLEARSLIASTREDVQPNIAPGGDQIAFVSRRSGDSQVWTAQDDGSELSQVTSLDGAEVQSVEWSPEGDRISFSARRKGVSDLYAVSASGGGRDRLTNSSAADRLPRWSPDGRWIYFASNRTGRWEIWRTLATPDSGRTEQVTKGGAVAAQKAPDDSTLYLVRSDTLGIWAAPFDSTALPINLSASSDSSAEAGGGSEDSLQLDEGQSEREEMGQSSPLRLVVGQFAPRDKHNWWVDENGIHFLSRRLNQVVLAYHDFASERILPLYEFRDWGRNRSFAVSPDGQWFVYTHVPRRESDIMLLKQGP